jgi:branched-chain amino acid transport system substrate-binding protein
VKAALESFTYNGVWNIRYDKTGELVFGFDVAHMKKGGVISTTHIEPK